MWIKGERNYWTTICNLFSAVEKLLMALMDTIKYADYYDV
jgi:hypothetical protein